MTRQKLIITLQKTLMLAWKTTITIQNSCQDVTLGAVHSTLLMLSQFSFNSQMCANFFLLNC
ncbi:unnamed protein product [Spirodela intermedia]|uniref:Uncharacterized protein n=1 Tax=Spirodela intermedia TaxID=51605 RepID=A0A7I8JCQ7_SPIIN|nr:unnamed protein product [Spirodela intermedia]CAA6667954.1 unnamed protein product [Spirodela intermedia]